MHRKFATALLLAAFRATASRADIIYESFPTPPATDNHATLDLNHDGIADFGFFIEHINAPPLFGYVHTVHGLAGLSTMMIASPRPVVGQSIGPTSTFASFGPIAASHHGHTTPNGGPVTWFAWDPDSPTNSDPAFLGLRFRDAQDQDHYAWLRYNIYNISVESFDVRLIDYAYQSVPNRPIDAGAVPAPWSVLPLVGVLAWRGRRLNG